MSFYDDYMAEGLCCIGCGMPIDDSEPGYPRMCSDCAQTYENQEAEDRRQARIKAWEQECVNRKGKPRKLTLRRHP